MSDGVAVVLNRTAAPSGTTVGPAGEAGPLAGRP